MNNLILIGPIKDLIDSKGLSKKYIKDAKFVLVSTDNIDYKMIVHLNQHPYDRHALAVFEYMEKNSLKEIYSFGGGKIVMGTIDEILFHDRSYAFHVANEQKLQEVARSIWPNFSLQICTMKPRLKEPQLLSREQIYEFATHP
ncbi:MAG: hypothetical protein KBD48_01910 [Candidatus Pacebacteria bacterium]|nr:hypothetical protein [Candidatus Paceibacterota bacterium]MBP9715920.1 hypothetical protein [Candidatus Paceibacterota bacterium]